MKSRKHSKIDKLDPPVREAVDEMIRAGAYYREIVDYIKSHGVSVSTASVGRYAKNLMSTLDSLRMSQENFRAIMEETERYPNLDVTEGILRIAGNRLINSVNEMGESEIAGRDMDALIRHTSALTRAVAVKRRADVQNKEVLEMGLEQFRSLIFEAMAEEKPELYREVKKFLKMKTEEV